MVSTSANDRLKAAAEALQAYQSLVGRGVLPQLDVLPAEGAVAVESAPPNQGDQLRQIDAFLKAPRGPALLKALAETGSHQTAAAGRNHHLDVLSGEAIASAVECWKPIEGALEDAVSCLKGIGSRPSFRESMEANLKQADTFVASNFGAEPPEAVASYVEARKRDIRSDALLALAEASLKECVQALGSRNLTKEEAGEIIQGIFDTTHVYKDRIAAEHPKSNVVDAANEALRGTGEALLHHIRTNKGGLPQSANSNLFALALFAMMEGGMSKDEVVTKAETILSAKARASQAARPLPSMGHTLAESVPSGVRALAKDASGLIGDLFGVFEV